MKKVLLILVLSFALFSCWNEKTLNYNFRDNYDAVFQFSWWVAKVLKDWKYWFIDTKWNVVVPLEYEVAQDYKDWYLAVSGSKYSNNFIYFDNKWNKINEPSPDMSNYGWFKEWLNTNWMDENRKPAIVDMNWKTILITLDVQGIWDFSEWLCRIKKNGRFWYINKSWEIEIWYKYDNAYDFKDWIAKVILWYKAIFINKSWKEILTLEDWMSTESTFGNWLLVVQKRDNGKTKYWVIDTTWKVIIPFNYKVEDYNDTFSDWVVEIVEYVLDWYKEIKKTWYAYTDWVIKWKQ